MENFSIIFPIAINSQRQTKTSQSKTSELRNRNNMTDIKHILPKLAFCVAMILTALTVKDVFPTRLSVVRCVLKLR